MIIKPKLRLLVIRHGESLGNVDREAHKQYPDNALPLTEKGKLQARDAGSYLNAFFRQPEFLEEYAQLVEQRKKIIAAREEYLHANPKFAEAFPELEVPKPLPEKPKIRLWHSPFLRTYETMEGIMRNASDVITDCRENPFIYEILFGLNDGLTDEERMQRNPEATKHYDHYSGGGGRHFVPMMLGESRAQVEVRTMPLLSTIHRDLQDSDIYTNVVVTHGVTSRIIAKAWMKYSVAEMTAEKNPGNCWIRYIEGHRKHERTDHRWVYQGQREQIEALEATMVRSR